MIDATVSHTPTNAGHQESAGNPAEVPGFLQARIAALAAGRLTIGARFLVGRERVAGEVDLIPRQQSHHVDEGGENTDGVCAAAEAEQPDAVIRLIALAEEAIGAQRVLIEPGSGGEAEHAADFLLEAPPCALQTDGTDAGMIIDALPIVLFENAKQFEDVRDVRTDLVAGAVAANDDVLRHPLSPAIARVSRRRIVRHRDF